MKKIALVMATHLETFEIKPSLSSNFSFLRRKPNFRLTQGGKVLSYCYDPENFDYTLLRQNIDDYLGTIEKPLKSITNVLSSTSPIQTHTIYYGFGNQLFIISGNPLVDQLVEEGYGDLKTVKKKMLEWKGK